MDLATARFKTDRSKEVGLRKYLERFVNSSPRQFTFESLLFATLAAVLAAFLFQLFMSAYNNFLGYKLPSFWRNLWVYVFLAAVNLVLGVIAGSYPALLLSSFSPIESLKGKLKVGKTAHCSGKPWMFSILVFE